MTRILAAFGLLFALSLAPPARAQHRSSGSHSHSSSAKSSSHSSGSNSHSSSSNSSSSVHSYRKNHLAEGVTPDPSVKRDKHGKIKRSTAAKDAFKREHPCPSNGNTRGGCPGYVIDHKNPLECGGADAPSNMQWQTVAEGKAKDKTERSCH
jgi:5-methylcytosine-specific restriction endonuclease McrA